MQLARDSTIPIIEWRGLSTAQVLLAMLAVAILMQIELVFSKSINWDEFHHFSQIHRHLQDRPMQWLQLPFVWLFPWVPSLSGDNISHIQLIRLLILPFELVTVGAIVASARSLAGPAESVFCGLLYVTGGYVFLHAFALRADMIAASLLTVALWIGICRPLRALELVALAALVTLAFISTIKSVLYAPALLGVALFRVQKPVHRWGLGGAAVLVLAAGALLLRIAPYLPEHGVVGAFRDIGLLGREAAGRMFSAGLFPQSEWLRGQIMRAPLVVVAVLVALIPITSRSRAPRERALLLSLLLPLCTVAIYRNAYPYHFVFILPPAMIAVAPAIGPLVRQQRAVWLGVVLLAIAALMSVSEDREVLLRQREIQAGLHEIFPVPVTYIDDCGVLSDFPRAINHYASGWGLASYRRKGLPAYRMAMESEPVPLLLANDGPFGTVCFDILHRKVLLPQDQRTIEENYIPHWGNAFVAGKQIAAGTQEQAFEIAIPGKYTVEGGPIVIDGRLYPVGNVLELSRGTHSASGDRSASVVLRWGDHLTRPAYTWPEEPILTEF
jgi:hypothetical protein